MRLYNEDCRDTFRREEMEDSVDLIVTSPPYAMQRKDTYGGVAVSEYVNWFLDISEGMGRCLKDTGSLVVNIKENVIDGQRDLYVYKLVIQMVEAQGWRFVEEYCWNKTNPFPTGNKRRLKDGFERCLHFAKTKKYKFFPENALVKSESKWLASEKRRKNKGTHNVTNGSGMDMSRRVASDMVRRGTVITGSTSNRNIAHPATFPLYLPSTFIELMTDEGDVVCDPFMGSGTTGDAAIALGRQFIGVEMDKGYFDHTSNRLNTPCFF
jgi:site-specific DNA-methyltransferase (adenine-specific)